MIKLNNEVKLICVTGPDGSGKTTLIKSILKRQSFEVVTIWDMMKDVGLKDVLYLKEREDVDRYLSLLTYPARTLFLFHCLSQALDLGIKKNTEHLILDGYWFKYAASEIALGGKEEEILNLAKIFPRPHLIFHLDLPPSIALQRKGGHSNYEGGMGKSFTIFQSQSSENLNRILSSFNSIRIDSLKGVEENTDVCLRHIHEL